MPKFNVGDRVQMPGIPFVVEVLEIGTCPEFREGDDLCTSPETFRFKDPGSGEDDWCHSDEFEKVGA